MHLKKITFTGIDDTVDLDELVEISLKYPFVEFGVLFSQKRQGSTRYPSSIFRQTLYETCEKHRDKIHLSAHFCGHYASLIMCDGVCMLDKIDSNYFERFQINFNASEHEDYDLINLVTLLKDFDVSAILQQNENNKILIKKLQLYKIELHPYLHKINILHDISGGKGIEITEIPKPFTLPETYTGYAGGMNVYNVKEKLEKIHELKDDVPFWIDMESGVRAIKDGVDIFDFSKVRQVIRICEPFIKH